MTLHLLPIESRPSPSAGPEGLAEFEAFVMADNAPAVLITDRELMRRLLDYMRHLEREAVREGSFR